MSSLTVEGVYKVHMAITIFGVVSHFLYFAVMMTEAFVQRLPIPSKFLNFK